MDHLLRCFLHILFLVLFPVVAVSQGGLSLFDIDATGFPTITAKFFALDGDGQPFRGLGESDFALAENGTLRPLQFFHCPAPYPPVPISSVLMIDVSVSMAGRNMDMARAAARLWVEMLPLGLSECAIGSFDHGSYLNLDFSTNRTKLLAAIGTLQPQGGTDYNAGFLKPPGGAIEIARRGSRKRVVVFLTDGQGVGDENAILQAAQSADVTVYCVALEMAMPLSLRRIASETGGAWFENLRTQEEVERVYRSILLAAQGIEPCRIAWESQPGCELLKEVKFDLPQRLLSTHTAYQAPEIARAALVAEPLGFSFGGVSPGEFRDRTLTLTAKNQQVKVLRISSDNPRFAVSDGGAPPEFTLQPGESRLVTLRFTPDDSSYTFGRITIESDACTPTAIYAAGGFPGKRASGPTLRLLAPNGGERFGVGDSVDITWTGVLPGDTLRLEYSTDAGSSWLSITDTAYGLSHRWKVPDTPSERCLARAVQSGAGGLDSVMILKGHISGLVSVDFNRDGGMVATGGFDNVARIWDAFTGQIVRELPQHIRSILSVEFSPDGSRLLVGTGAMEVKLWDIVTAVQVGSFRSAHGIPSYASFSPDGSRVVANSYTSSLTVWEAATGTEILELDGHRSRGFTVEFSPDGSRIVSGAYDSTARIWDAQSGTLLHTLVGHDNAIVNSVAFSPDGGRVVTTGNDSTIRIWDAGSGALLRTIHDRVTVNSARYSPDGERILSGGDDSLVKIWDAASGNQIRQLIGHRGAISSVCFNPDGDRVLSGSWDNTARLWDLERGALQQDISDAYWAIVQPQFEAIDIDMGTVALGDSKDSVISLFLCNRGTLPVQIDEIRFTGGDSSDFSLVSGAPPYQLAAGNCYPIEIRFVPSAAGERSTGIAIVSPGGILRPSLRGRGTGQRLEVVAQPIDFGMVPIGSVRDSTVDLIVRNASPYPVTIDDVVLLGPDVEQFSILSGDSSFVLAPGVSQSMSLRFAPQSAGRTSGRIGFVVRGAPPAIADLAGEGICASVTGSSVRMPVVTGDPGDTVTIPLLLDGWRELAQRDGGRFTLRLRFNTSMLLPIDSIASTYNLDGERVVTLGGVWDRKSDTLLSLRFLVALGDSDRTPLDVDLFVWNDDCPLDATASPGLFALLHPCREGGTRLFHADGRLSLKPSSPNPASGVVTVEYETIEEGEIRLVVIDRLGREVATPVAGRVAAGSYRVSYDAGGLASGIYYWVLKTPAGVLVRAMEVRK